MDAARTEPKRVKDSAIWNWLAFLWGLYYFGIFSLGRYREYTQYVIWVGGGFLLTLMLVTYLWRRSRIPTESLILGVFIVWSLTGLPFLSNGSAYWLYLRTFIQMTVVITCISLVLRRSGAMHWLYWAFLCTMIFNVLVGLDPISAHAISRASEPIRQAGLTRNPNALGFYSIIGLLGAMALWGTARSWLVKFLLIPGACFCLYGIVASGSRGAFMALCLAIVLWPLMCFRSMLPKNNSFIFGILVAGIAIFLTGSYILNHTYLGRRVSNTFSFGSKVSDTSVHLESRREGLRLFLANPIIGIGLGQLPFTSSTGMYAHNEFVELLATAGLIGFSVYFGFYWFLWRRLARIRRKLKDPHLLYKANFARMVLIIIVVSGAIFRPNFLAIDTYFVLGTLVGTADWLHLQANMATPNKP